MTVKKLHKQIKQITDYSFIAKTNGMAVIYLDNKQNNKEEEYLICACKKYNDNQKNGILLVNIQNNYKPKITKVRNKFVSSSSLIGLFW